MTGNKKYFIGLSNKPNEYILYYLMDNQMIYLSRYDNPDDAISALNKYSLIGTTDRLALEIFDQIAIFVENEINIRDFILSMFVTFKYADTVEFQHLIQILTVIDNNGDVSIYSNNKELVIYTALYNYMTSIQSTLNLRILYDPSSNVISSLISYIMGTFGYESTEGII